MKAIQIFGVLLEAPFFSFAPPAVPRARFFQEGETRVLNNLVSPMGITSTPKYPGK